MVEEAGDPTENDEFRKSDVQELYGSFTRKKKLFILFSFFLLFGISFVALTQGASSIGIEESISAVLSRPLPSLFTSTNFSQTTIWSLRLPRICMAMVAGVALAIAGVVMQCILRNPLASPYTLGIASGAGFGAALAIVLGAGVVGYKAITFTHKWMIVSNAFIFSLVPAFVVFGLSKFKRATSGTMVLAGIAMMYLFSAGLSLLQYFGGEAEVTAVVYWLFGSLSKANWLNTGAVAGTAFSLAVPLLCWSWDFNALSAGDETARGLGVNVERVRLGGMIIASLMTAAAVSFLGTIGFIGLVSPHITRMIIGGDHRFLLPASSLVGAIVLLAADTAARTVLSPLVLPVGILTSFLGVPLFLYLIMRRGREYW